MSMDPKYHFSFPENWDRNNQLALRQYERCAQSFTNINDFLKIYTRSIVYHIIVWCLLIYTTISLILIFFNKNNYSVLKLNKTLMVIYAFSGIICILNCYLRNVFYESIPCAVVIFLLDLGYIPNFLSCMGCIMYYLQQCYLTNNSYNKALNKNFIKQGNFFYRACLNFKEEKYVKFILHCTLGGILFSSIFGIKGDYYSFVPLTRGFCTTNKTEGYPMYLSLLLYFIFSFFALYELHKLGNDFNLRKSLIITLYFSIFLLSFTVLGNMTSYVKCASLMRYIPHDSLLQIFSCVFNYTHITFPLIQLFYTKYEVKKLELTKSGLIHLLNDTTLFNEFLNFCNTKRCVEGVIFHREYKKFKNVFKDGGKKLASAGEAFGTSSSNSSNYAINIDLLYQNITGVSNDPLPYFENSSYNPPYNNPSYNNPSYNDPLYNYNNSNEKYLYNSPNNNSSYDSYNNLIPTLPQPKQHRRMMSFGKKRKDYVNINNTGNTYMNSNQIHVDKKIVHIYDEIFEKANLIFNFFFTQNSDYELNVPDPVVKKIDSRLKSFNQHYSKMKNNQLFLYEELECEDIFDEAYEEVIQSLYHNTYSAFVLHKRRHK